MFIVRTEVDPQGARKLAQEIERALRRRGIRSKIPEADIEAHQRQLDALAGVDVYVRRPDGPHSS